MATIKYDGVEKTYPDGTRAIPGISLEVRDREFMVFVGPSGCGKTTVLRMTAGLEDITGGRLYIGDRVVNSLPPQKRDIAMVFQDYALYPHMTVRDNIGFALRMMGRPKSEIRQRVEAAAARLSLTALLDRKPRNLSGGQRQRVAMGRAIVREPQAFLMDEPLSNLDAKLRVQMRAEISSLQRQLGVTTVYVTHDQVEAMTMGDRVAVMKSGLLQQVAPPEELYERPVNIFVAGFIGSPKMNLFESVLRRRPGGGAYVTFGQQELAIPDDVQSKWVSGPMDSFSVPTDRPIKAFKSRQRWSSHSATSGWCTLLRRSGKRQTPTRGTRGPSWKRSRLTAAPACSSRASRPIPKCGKGRQSDSESIRRACTSSTRRGTRCSD